MQRFCAASPCLSILLFAILTPAHPASRIDPSSVLIVVNDNTPPEPGTDGKGAGQFVADHYAAARGIPAANIVHIRTTMACCAADPRSWDSWSISWREFVDDVREPIKAFLKSRRLTTKIKYIVPTYGVPTHVENHPLGADSLSVDALLAIMNTRYADYFCVQNPLYRGRFSFRVFRSPLYVVARLDGPSAEIAAALVDKALLAEKGLSRKSGAGYFDWRHLSPDSGYYPADQTMLAAYEACVAAGLECVLNDQTMTGGMILSAPETIWAWGWYSGEVNDVYTFVPGAVGAQLTSYTARSVRTAEPGAWVPVWLERGITATWGATGEPYADRYAMGDVLLERLWSGSTFGEAAYSACPFLAWKMVFVGDPLYSPRFID